MQNSKVHVYSIKRDYATHDYDELIHNEQISAVEPQLWSAMQSLT